MVGKLCNWAPVHFFNDGFQQDFHAVNGDLWSLFLHVSSLACYLTKLLGNDAVKSGITRHEPESLEHFELVIKRLAWRR